MPSHEQIKRAREAAPPWHQEVVAKHAAKRPKRFPFSPLELTWLVMVSYDDGEAWPQIGQLSESRIGDFGVLEGGVGED